MSRQLGRQVKQKISKAHRNEPVLRLKDDCELLAKEHRLTCCLAIPDAAADLDITADLTKRTITCSMRLSAPQDKVRSAARVNWLIKQVSKANAEGFFVKAMRPGRAEETQTPLAKLLADGNALETLSTNVVPSAFEVFYMADLGARFSGPKVFIEELEKAVPHFYQEVGQKLRAWVAPPPKLQKRDPVELMAIEDSEEAELAACEAVE